MPSSPNRLTGYLDAPGFLPGDVLSLRTSAHVDGTAHLVRLRHGDTNPEGPGMQYTIVPGAPEVVVPGRTQELRPGSSAVFDLDAAVDSGWTFALKIWPTANERWIAQVRGGGRIVGLAIDDRSALVVDVDGLEVHTSLHLRHRRWQGVVVTITGEAVRCSLVDGAQRLMHAAVAPPRDVAAVDRIVLADAPDAAARRRSFDGRLEAPRLFSGVVDVDAALGDPLPANGCVFAVDFSSGISSMSVRDAVSGSTAPLRNAPTRAVTGHLWRGEVESWVEDPAQYGAIHFHSDDLGDARWEQTATFPLPADLPSGLYALHVRAGDDEDWLTFAVTPRPDGPHARLAVQLPTLTYLAYANEPIFHPHVPLHRDERDDWATEHELVSQYNWHRDGSGVVYASWRKPMMNLRPDYRYWLTGTAHGPGGDLYLLHWLDAHDIPYDVITDHLVAASGGSIYAPYDVVVTGAHPEYWTREMLAALGGYLDDGGRVAYLGGNGFAATVALHPEDALLSEMRRSELSPGLWEVDPGETVFAATGLRGGLTRHLGLRARELVGVDIAGMGFADGREFARTDASDDPRAEFIFEGVTGRTFGDFGLVMGGAAGYEIDSADHRTGTPPHALVVATSEGFGATYVPTEQRADTRADVVFFETPAGGAVFSSSSIAWTGALSQDDFDNDVSRITANVLRRFLDPTPFPYSRDLRGNAAPTITGDAP